MNRVKIFLLYIILLSNVLHAEEVLIWKELPELPPLPGESTQPGLAGAFAGVHNDALILAGGANFPDGLPWIKLADGSSPNKIYHREIYVLQKDKPWIISDVSLPKGYSYGFAIPTEDGLLCIGGEWSEYQNGSISNYKSNHVFLIKHLGNGKLLVDSTSFPLLPEAISDMAGAKIGDYIYIVGGNNGITETKSFLRLNYKKRDMWEVLDPWSGAPRSHLITVAQSDGRKQCLFVFSGRYRNPEKGWQFLNDGFKFDPDTETWTKIAGVGTNLENKNPVCAMAAPAIKIGSNHIMIFGGALGDLFRKVEQDIPNQIAILEKNGKIDEARALANEKWALYTHHPGFSRDILVYHTITDTWIKAGQFPESVIDGITVGSHVTVQAVQWGKNIVIPSGEVRPGVRSPKIWVASQRGRSGFGTVNTIVLGTYLTILLMMGFYFMKREKGTDDFFRAGGRVPWWAAGLSIFGTQLSAITFMAIPAKSFATDWTWIVLNMTIILVAPFIIFLFLPFYRRLNVTTAYEYIEKRFNVIVRMTASAMFMVFQFARIGIVLFLPSIALSVVTGIDIRICITVMALLSIAYTVMGGIEAVIWTDVLQVVVLLGGAILVLILIPSKVEGGAAGIMKIAADAEKLRLFDFHFNLKSPTLWVLVFGGIGANLISYGSDQAVIQRYLTTKDQKSAARGIWTNGVLTIPASIIFFGLGTVLYAFFKSNPETLSITMNMPDAIFPWFIVTQLPAGLAGLLIAGIFAAAMSSLDSSMNSVAAAFTTDFYRRFSPSVAVHTCLMVARIVTVVIGFCGMVFALAMATWDIQSLWLEFSKYIGLFGGGLGGLFILAIFTRRASSSGAMIGLFASAFIQYFLNSNDSVHGVLFAATGMITCLVIGYFASLVVPGNKRNLTGLTLFSLKKCGENKIQISRL